MGTYTDFNLTLIVEDDDKNKYSEKEIIAHLRSEFHDAEGAIDENGNTLNEEKWYDCDENLKEFSKKYPEVIFGLTLRTPQCYGEEDLYPETYYYKNGEAFTEPPIKTEWEIWMEKSKVARNQR